MGQYNIGKCPINGNTVVAFEGTASATGKFGLARSRSSSYEYLDANFVWQYVSNPIYVATSKEENEAKWQECLKLIIHVRPIVPVLIDTSPGAMAIKYRCPACAAEHKSRVQADSFEQVRQVIERKCPKDAASAFTVRLWNGDEKARKPTAPFGPVGRIGNEVCKECNGSGDYVGFTAVEPCSQCFPVKKN